MRWRGAGRRGVVAGPGVLAAGRAGDGHLQATVPMRAPAGQLGQRRGPHSHAARHGEQATAATAAARHAVAAADEARHGDHAADARHAPAAAAVRETAAGLYARRSAGYLHGHVDGDGRPAEPDGRSVAAGWHVAGTRPAGQRSDGQHGQASVAADAAADDDAAATDGSWQASDAGQWLSTSDLWSACLECHGLGRPLLLKRRVL